VIYSIQVNVNICVNSDNVLRILGNYIPVLIISIVRGWRTEYHIRNWSYFVNQHRKN